MQPRAVIFDLFGTLVPANRSAHTAVVAEMARALTTNPFEFAAAWERVETERETSGGGTLEGDIYDALRYLLAFTHREQVQAAVDLMLGFERGLLVPRPGAVDLLRRLKDASVRIGVVANAGPRLTGAWPASTLAPLVDAAVFSCQAGERLPSARICHAIAGGLSTPPESCAFVSDDERNALASEAVGMKAVLYTDEAIPDPADARAAPEARKRRVASLDQVLDCVIEEAFREAP